MNSSMKKDVSMATKKRLGKLFMCIGEQEQSIEISRQILCNCPEFEPYSSFKRLDRHGKGYITYNDLLDFSRYENFCLYPIRDN